MSFRSPPVVPALALAIAVAALIVLMLSLRGIAGFYTDYLWFDSLGYTAVWRGVLLAQILLALVFSPVRRFLERHGVPVGLAAFVIVGLLVWGYELLMRDVSLSLVSSDTAVMRDGTILPRSEM